MSWNQTNKTEEKIKFIADWLNDEFNFSELCRRYNISRRVGYELVKRFEFEGEKAFLERSRARHTHPNETPFLVRAKIIELKTRKPDWGPVTLRHELQSLEPHVMWPAVSTIGDLLKRQGLVKPRKRRRHVSAYSYPFLTCEGSNQIWSADFKGHFKLGNGRYCYPLTVSDNYSRFVLATEALLRPTKENCIKQFKKLFSKYGLPDAIRTDNGSPFASQSIGGLSELSVWWLKLGIIPERIAKGCPSQNGRHERMHRTLKAFIKESRKNLNAQQKIFEDFIKEFNYERPHQALKGKKPCELYVKSEREYSGKTPEISYPDHYAVRKVRSNGEIKLFGKCYYVGELLRGEPVGLELLNEDRAYIYFSKLKLGTVDARKEKIDRF